MESTSNHAWLPDIRNAMVNYGGKASLKQMYRYIQRNRTKLPAEYESVIRANIYAHSSDAKAFVQGNPDIFYKCGRGEWGLRYPDDVVPSRSNDNLLSIACTIMLREMSGEEMRTLASRQSDFIAELHRRVATLREKYHMDKL